MCLLPLQESGALAHLAQAHAGRAVKRTLALQPVLVHLAWPAPLEPFADPALDSAPAGKCLVAAPVKAMGSAPVLVAYRLVCLFAPGAMPGRV